LAWNSACSYCARSSGVVSAVRSPVAGGPGHAEAEHRKADVKRFRTAIAFALPIRRRGPDLCFFPGANRALTSLDAHLHPRHERCKLLLRTVPERLHSIGRIDTRDSECAPCARGVDYRYGIAVDDADYARLDIGRAYRCAGAE
jgi:hypothetical protein